MTLSSLPEQQATALQQRALSLIVDAQPSFVDSIISIYQLQSLDPEGLRSHILWLQGINCYKEVKCLKTFAKNTEVFPVFICAYLFFFLQAAVLGMKLQLQTNLNMEEVSCLCNHEQLIYLIILYTHLTILILFLGPKSGLVANNYLCLVSI